MAAGDVFEDTTDVSAGSTSSITLGAGVEVVISMFGSEGGGSVDLGFTDGTDTIAFLNGTNTIMHQLSARPVLDGDGTLTVEYQNTDACNARKGSVTGREI